MDIPFPVNKMLIKSLAAMAKHSEETLHQNNTCLQVLKDTILVANKNGLLALKASLVAFTESEAERNFHNKLISLYLQLIEQHLKNR
ncbi:hypothetical protein [Rhodocytophaga aerolata]